MLGKLTRWQQEPPDWSSHLCWTNLLKVAPADGGNPEGKLRQAQIASSVDLLAIEIAEFRPSRVLVLAGWDWFGPQFADGLRLRIERRQQSFVEGVATDSGCRWVVAKHPERKAEDPAVEEILAAFG